MLVGNTPKTPTSSADVILADDEVPPVFEANNHGASPFLFTCDHYGRLLPRALGQLGLPDSELSRHIAWDIGIAGVATALAKAMDAHLIAQRYSRLVIDCNRPPGVPSSIPIISETTSIPGNVGLSPESANLRRQIFFDSYHRRIGEMIDQRQRDGRPTILISLHSFTPVYKKIARPWHIGTLYHRDKRVSQLLLQALRAENDLIVGDNEPYAVSDTTDYTIPVHGEQRGLMNCGIEIRQDLISEPLGQQHWAERLKRILRGIEKAIKMSAATTNATLGA
jgi:predicted N-formylglutamate amidohydrolase